MDQAELTRITSELATMKAALAERATKLAELEARPVPVPDADRVDALATKLADLDERVTAVSTELANQITELGREFDAASTSNGNGNGNGHEVAEAALGELRNGQVRLATEQARYQIAFREDLARLAELLRRPSA